MQTFIVYKYTSPKKKCYIGYTYNPKQRTKDHRKKEWDYSDTTKFANAIRKYGFEALTYEVIDHADTLEEIGEKEKYWIKFYDSINSGYNICEGGVSPVFITFSEREIADVVSLLKNTNLKQCEIAKITGISAGHITAIKKGERRTATNIDRPNAQEQKGMSNSQSKLTDELVGEIRTKLESGIDRKLIQEEYAISKSLVQQIATNQIWQHVKSNYIYVAKEENGNAKLNKDIVANIKQDLRDGTLLKKEIFKKYGISRATLTQIQTGRTWKDVK